MRSRRSRALHPGPPTQPASSALRRNAMPSGDLHPMTGQDALSPSEVAFLVETRGVAKATAPIVTTFVLGVVAGAFIALGGLRDHDRDGVRVGFRTDTFARWGRFLARPHPGGRRGGGAVHGE